MARETVIHQAPAATGSVLVLSVDGELDNQTAGFFRQELFSALARDHRLVVLRMTNVPYMNSAGVAVLLEAMREARHHERRLAVLAPSRAVQQALAIVSLDTFIAVYDTPEACAAGERLGAVESSTLSGGEAPASTKALRVHDSGRTTVLHRDTVSARASGR